MTHNHSFRNASRRLSRAMKIRETRFLERDLKFHRRPSNFRAKLIAPTANECANGNEISCAGKSRSERLFLIILP